MEKNIYDKIEYEIKKYKHFGRDKLQYDISMIIASCLIIASSTLIILGYTVLGWTIIGTIIGLYFIYCNTAPTIIVFRYFKDAENRKIIQNELSEKSKTVKKVKKYLKMLDFSKPLNWSFAFEVDMMDYLQKIISQITRPSLLDIIKKYGINNNDLLKEAIEHYRFKIATTKSFNISIIPILSFLVSIISLFIKDLLSAAIVMTIVFLLVIALYFAILSYKKNILSPYSKNALYKKLELALSEIYISNELNNKNEMENEHKVQFGFTSHLM